MGAEVSTGISSGVGTGVGAGVLFGVRSCVGLAASFGVGAGRLVLCKTERVGFVVGQAGEASYVWYGEKIQARKLSVDSVRSANVRCVTQSH